MISEKLQNAINEQITAEMWSANLYLSMSCGQLIFIFQCLSIFRKKVTTDLLHG